MKQSKQSTQRTPKSSPKLKINEGDVKTNVVIHKRHKATVSKSKGENVSVLEALLDQSRH